MNTEELKDFADFLTRAAERHEQEAQALRDKALDLWEEVAQREARNEEDA